VDVVAPGEASRVAWLRERIHAFVDEGQVIVFASRKQAVDDVVATLREAGVRAEGVHGDMDQARPCLHWSPYDPVRVVNAVS
jgi:ATP-dependent RNA helicase DDX42